MSIITDRKVGFEFKNKNLVFLNQPEVYALFFGTIQILAQPILIIVGRVF